MHRVGKCLDTVNVSPGLPKLAGEASLETFFYAVPSKQNYIFRGSSVILFLMYP